MVGLPEKRAALPYRGSNRAGPGPNGHALICGMEHGLRVIVSLFTGSPYAARARAVVSIAKLERIAPTHRVGCRTGLSSRLLLPWVAIAAVFLCTACKEPAEQAVPRLVKELSAKDAHRRSQAALSLAEYGPEAQEAVKPLIRRLKDSNRGVQSSAAYALRKIDSPAARAALDAYQAAREAKRRRDRGLE